MGGVYLTVAGRVLLVEHRLDIVPAFRFTGKCSVLARVAGCREQSPRHDDSHLPLLPVPFDLPRPRRGIEAVWRIEILDRPAYDRPRSHEPSIHQLRPDQSCEHYIGSPILDSDGVPGAWPRLGSGLRDLCHVRPRGGPRDRTGSDHLLKALAVAIPDYDITIDVREVEELGPDGIDALSRVSRKIHEWRAGRLFILAPPDEGVWGELESSELADVGKHPRIYLAEATESRNRHSN